MPRRSRSTLDGTHHHVIVRAVDEVPLFPDDAARSDFLRLFGRALEAHAVGCLTYAVLTTHAHFAVRGRIARVSKCMHLALTPYASRRNWSGGRRGHVLGDRFWSRPVESDTYLIRTVDYIHRNLFDAGIVHSVASLADTPWSGFGAMVGLRSSAVPLCVEEGLRLYGVDTETAQRALAGHAGAALEQAQRDRRQPSYAGIVRQVCSQMGVVPDLLSSRRERSSAVVTARRAVIRRARVELGLGDGELARRLGLSRQAVQRLRTVGGAAPPRLRTQESACPQIASSDGEGVP